MPIGPGGAGSSSSARVKVFVRRIRSPVVANSTTAACAKLVHSLPPRVTVFIPTYNRARFPGPEIASIHAQTNGDFRLEISDNASTDETPDVVEPYDDPRIGYIVHPQNI